MTVADDFLAELTEGTFREWARELVTDDPLEFTDRYSYADRLKKLHTDDPNAEAVRAGFAQIGRHDIAVICSDYDFLAGTLGIAAAERVARTFVAATVGGRPVIGICRSGGTRMQEGTPAFIKMMSIVAAISEHRETGLPYLSYLMSPAMGGALAAWGNQGHVVWAAPGATISLTGPRVAEVVTGEIVPLEEVSAEAALERGLIDAIVAPDALAARVTAWLDVVKSGTTPGSLADQVPHEKRLTDEPQDAWQSVVRSRAPDRPDISTLMEATDVPLIEIRGDRAGKDDRGLLAGFTKIRGQSVVVQGFRRPDGRGAEVSPSGYRKALRVLALAEELNLPHVAFIDTRGAGVGVAVEAEGLAHVVGTLMRELLRVRVATVSVLVGEGAGAGAIALLAADSVVALEHAWLTPIAPEAGSAILFRNPHEAPRMARSQAAGADRLRSDGLVDVVVPEGVTVADSCERLMDAVAGELATAQLRLPEERLASRRVHVRNLARQYLTIRDSGVAPFVL